MYSSVLPRAVQTAEIIAPSIGDGGLDLQSSCDLCEQHAGEADGLTWEDANAKYLDNEPAPFQGNPFRALAPGGETVAQFVSRAGTALHNLARRHPGETVVVACHGGVIRSAFVAFGAVALPFLASMRNENTGINEWEYDEDAGTWQLVRHNDHAHLAYLRQ
jgi:probable phosphoglycerate mutase